ncbi:MAG: type II toxin-antitoxin system VapC family toxin [Acidobacteria bacterium]|nr:type II toxin-antitoxin system VapC family toxin [Acidobacteriota bacterium]
MRYVLDASVAVRWFIEEERHESAEAVHRRIVDEPHNFAVPELFAYETFATLFRIHPRPLKAFQDGILPILGSGILRYPMTDAIAARAAELVKTGLTGYDACYAALAEELDALWLTFDGRAHARIRHKSISVDLGIGLPAGW